MKVLTTGSRDWVGIWGEWRITLTLNRIELLAHALESPLILANGVCPEGADAIVNRWAARRRIPVKEFPADWLKYGKPAGPIRNKFMVSQGADMCVAFLKDGSSGTQGTVDLAREARIPTFVVPWLATDTEQLNDLQSYK